MLAAALIAGAYLLGAVPFGLLLARHIAGLDVRAAGSGNIGATNVARSAGRGLGVATLVLDALKGAAPVLVGRFVLDAPTPVVAAAGAAAVLGHVFPIYLKFRGGKGVATGLGVFLALAPLATLIAVGVFAVVFAVARVVSLGSLCGAVTLVGALVALEAPRAVVGVAGGVVLLIAVRHTGNIRRLLAGRERGV